MKLVDLCILCQMEVRRARHAGHRESCTWTVLSCMACFFSCVWWRSQESTVELYLGCVMHDLFFVLCQVEVLDTDRCVPGLCHAWPSFCPVRWRSWESTLCWAWGAVPGLCHAWPAFCPVSGGGVGRAHRAEHGGGEVYVDCVMHDLLFVLCQVESVEHIVLGMGEMYLYCVVMHDLLYVVSGGGVGRAHCAGHGGAVPGLRHAWPAQNVLGNRWVATFPSTLDQQLLSICDSSQSWCFRRILPPVLLRFLLFVLLWPKPEASKVTQTNKPCKIEIRGNILTFCFFLWLFFSIKFTVISGILWWVRE